MLTVLYGPSCVGKTTLINILVNRYQWKPINCYLTRDLRSDDVARISITPELFHEKEIRGEFQCVNHQFQSSYGTPRDELINATTISQDSYILDFMLKNYAQLEDLEHTKILILPETRDTLKSQIIAANRKDRESEILLDLDDNYSEEKILACIAKGFKILTVKYNCIDTNLKTFMELINYVCV